MSNTHIKLITLPTKPITFLLRAFPNSNYQKSKNKNNKKNTRKPESILVYPFPLCTTSFPLHKEMLLIPSEKYFQNLTTSHLSSATIQIQATIISWLHSCNCLLTGFTAPVYCPTSASSILSSTQYSEWSTWNLAKILLTSSATQTKAKLKKEIAYKTLHNLVTFPSIFTIFLHCTLFLCHTCFLSRPWVYQPPFSEHLQWLFSLPWILCSQILVKHTLLPQNLWPSYLQW